MSRRCVAITGVGALCSLGIGHEAIWEGVCAGRSGVGPIQCLDAGDFPSKLTAEIPGFVPKDYVPQRKSLKVMARDIQIAVAAAELAANDARLDDAIDPTRLGCSMGAGLITADIHELGPSLVASIEDGAVALRRWGSEVMSNLFPLWLLKYLPNMLACHISIFRNAQGPNNTITTGDAAAIEAVGEACHVIERGAADVFIAGGADSPLTPLALLRFEMLNQLSHRNDDPAGALAPFDLDRDGFVAGEGAAVVILEEMEHARRRDASIYAAVAGYGCASQASRPIDLVPSSRGIALAMRHALADAGITADEISFVCAHADGTRAGDAAEAAAIRDVFGDRDVLVTAPKSMIGQTVAGSGALDVALCALAVWDQRIPGTPNYRTPDPECPVNVLAGAGRDAPVEYVMVNAVATCGQCASIILTKPKG